MPPFVVIADRTGGDYERWSRALHALKIPHLYFLEGGLEGLQQARAQQQGMITGAGRGCAVGSCGAR